MAKKQKKQEINTELDNIPKEMQDKLKKIKTKLDKFSKQVTDKFGQYILGISLSPPKKDEKDKINLLILVDDRDSKKMSKDELKNKLHTIIVQIATDIDKNIHIETIILTELWESCMDGKHELLQLIGLSAPIYDTGMLGAIKIGEIHKSMTLKKFEKYIVSYFLAGSLVQGTATPESDIDVGIIIDDTDVKRMTRTELKDKLRAIIYSMGLEAGQITGIKNKLNIQVWILTEFWDGLKEANPVFFTFVRDGIPFYDRGLFVPWKQLLKMGKIKPSPEAIDMFKTSGEQLIKRARYKLKEIAMEDSFWSILSPSQAALMLYGLPPPTPKETPKVIREIFVKKEKLLEEKWVKILEKNIQIRKDLEHGSKKDVTGKEVDEILNNAENYLKRIQRLFTQIEQIKEKENILHIYETTNTLIRDMLKTQNITKVQDVDLLRKFENELISTGKVPAKILRLVDNILESKKKYDNGDLVPSLITTIRKDSNDLLRFGIEFLQRSKSYELEKVKIRIKQGNVFNEILILNKKVFIIKDGEEKEYQKAEITKDGELIKIKKSTSKEYEKAISKVENLEKVFIKEKTFESLKSLFGKEIEILINY